MSKKNPTFVQKSDKLFDALGVVYAQVHFGGQNVAEVWTREGLNRAVGKMADLGLDLQTDGYHFLCAVSERLAPNTDAIARNIATKKIEVSDLSGCRFKPCNDANCKLGRHVTFVSTSDDVQVYSFEQALDLIRSEVNTDNTDRALPVKAGIRLLQDVLESRLPRCQAP